MVDAAWDTVSAGISKLTVVASAAASAVKPGLQEVTQRYQRGELASTAAQLAATGADLGLRGLSSLKGLLKNAVTQLDAYANDNPNAGRVCVASLCVARPSPPPPTNSV